MTTQKSTLQRPPKEMLKNVSTGMELKKQWGRGGEEITALVKGEALSLSTIRELNDFFNENSFDSEMLEKDGGPTAATIEWLIKGGTAGKEWSQKVISKLSKDNSFTCSSNILKVDESLGLVMGWAIICDKNGEPYYDLQKDHIPPEAMLKASVDFMQGARIVGDMHTSEEGGQVVFAWPMTAEIAKAFNIQTDTTGLMIAIKPANQKTLEKFKNGTYNGFSIGGNRVTDEEVDDA